MFGMPNEILVGLLTGVLSFFAKNAAMKRQDQKELMELALTNAKAEDDFRNNAAKRSSPVLRKIVAMAVIFVAFGGLLYMGVTEKETTMLIAGKSKSILFGLFSWETDPKIVGTHGFFLADYMRFGVIQVLSFLFGGSLAKASR